MSTVHPAVDDSIEMSRLIAVHKVNQAGSVQQSFKATDEECVDLASRLGILSLSEFSGDVNITYVKSNKSYSVSGSFKAIVTQECRTTFTPITQTVKDQFSETLVMDGNAPTRDDDVCEEQVTEVFYGDEIDYGEIVTQWLCLALDPYPRAEGEIFEHIEYIQQEINPFSALKAITPENNQKK